MTRGIAVSCRGISFAGFSFPLASAPDYRPGEKGGPTNLWAGGPSGREPGQGPIGSAQAALTRKTIDWALKAGRRVVRCGRFRIMPAARQYWWARCFEENWQDEKAFKRVPKSAGEQPKISNYEEILQRQVAIRIAFLGGKMVPAMGLHSFLPLDGTDRGYVRENCKKWSI